MHLDSTLPERPLCRGHPQAGWCLPAGSYAESHTISSSQQPYLFRRQGYFSSKNLRESSITEQKKAYAPIF